MSAKGTIFYNIDDIESLLICAFCNEKLSNEVKCLPCGQSICGSCYTQISQNEGAKETFICQICQSQHNLDELTTNAILDRLLAVKPKRVTRGDKFDSLLGILNDLQAITGQVKSFHEIMEIENYCERLVYQVTLATESAIDHLNKQHTLLLDQIQIYRAELISAYESNRINSKSKMDLDAEKLLNVVDQFCFEWSKQLEENELNDRSIEKSNQKGLEHKNQMRNMQDVIKKYLFKDRYLKFTENESFFSLNEHLGKLDFYNSFGVQLSK